MTAIKMYSAEWCPDCRRAKAFLDENNIKYTYIDISKNEEAAKEVQEINGGKRIIPTFVIDNTPFANPTNASLGKILKV